MVFKVHDTAMWKDTVYCWIVDEVVFSKIYTLYSTLLYSVSTSFLFGIYSKTKKDIKIKVIP